MQKEMKTAILKNFEIFLKTDRKSEPLQYGRLVNIL